MQDIGTAIGGRYIDDTYEGGRIRSIYVQLDGQQRNEPEDLTGLMVHRSGDLVSVENVARLLQKGQQHRPLRPQPFDQRDGKTAAG